MDQACLFSRVDFSAECWMTSLRKDCLPSSRVKLAQLPTPTHRIKRVDSSLLPDSFHDFDLFIKRDDLTSFELSGNKVRKLEFLLADALDGGFDSVITIGGLQSNHCRATAVAARQLGLQPYLILRTELSPEDIALEGNLLLSRMAGAKIYTVKPKDYYEKGGDYFVHQLAEKLQANEGLKCYEIPSGGSNLLGTFGYMNAITEMISTESPIPYDHIVFACGSGGTAAGLAIGAYLSKLKAKLHAVCVCDTPDDFYEFILRMAVEMGVEIEDGAERRSPQLADVRQWITVHDGQGEGYGLSTTEELQLMYDLSRQTGVMLDPVYSGKAFYAMSQRLVTSEEFRPGQRVLFLHTGGVLGSYAKSEQLLPLITAGKHGVAEEL